MLSFDLWQEAEWIAAIAAIHSASCHRSKESMGEASHDGWGSRWTRASQIYG